MPPSIDALISSSASAWPTAPMALNIPLPSPKVMVPKQSLETRRPVGPSVAYFMTSSFLVGMSEHSLIHETKESFGDCVPERIKPGLGVALCLGRLTGDEIHRRIGDRTHDRRHEGRRLVPHCTTGRALTHHVVEFLECVRDKLL